MIKHIFLLKINDEGQFLVIFAILLVVFLGILAFAVDGGRIYIEQRRTQNAADNAAIAGALALCRGDSTSLIIDEGRYIAGENGYDNDGTTNTVTINIPPVYGSSAGRSGAVEAIVQSEIHGTFAQIINVSSFTVTSRAVATCTYTSKYAIFAGGTDCDKQIEWSGSTNLVKGAVHSNNNIHISGADNTVNGHITYLDPGDSYFHESTTIIPETGNPEPLDPNNPLPYPVDFHHLDYVPGGTEANEADLLNQYYSFIGKIDNGVLQSEGLLIDNGGGNWVLSDGLYYTPDDIDLSVSDTTGNAVTFVAGGTISMSGSDQKLLPYLESDLLAYSYAIPDNQCSDTVVKFNGSGFSEWMGIVFAPDGVIDMSGSDNTSFSGSLIGYTIKLGGSTLQINIGDELSAPIISLIE